MQNIVSSIQIAEWTLFHNGFKKQTNPLRNHIESKQINIISHMLFKTLSTIFQFGYFKFSGHSRSTLKNLFFVQWWRSRFSGAPVGCSPGEHRGRKRARGTPWDSSERGLTPSWPTEENQWTERFETGEEEHPNDRHPRPTITQSNNRFKTSETNKKK